MIRRLGLTLISSVLSPFAFRLSVGRWPSKSENRQFARALSETGLPVPAIPRALIALPAARLQVSNMIKLHLIQQGKLPKSESGELPPRSGNALRFWQGPPLSFLHFERTAGTTFATALIEECHPLQIFAAPHAQAGLPEQASTTATPMGELADCKFLWGHYDLATLRGFGERRMIITMLREPAARIVSLYYFWRSIQPGRPESMSDSRVLLAQRLDLLDFLLCDDRSIRDSIDNVYVRRLAGVGGITIPDPDHAVSRAQEALKAFAFIGISEHMSLSLNVLGSVLGIKLGDPSVRENTHADNAALQPALYRNIARQEITPAVEGALAPLALFDRVIYEACRQKLLSKDPLRRTAE